MQVVANPIRAIVITITTLRPNLSPIRPNKSAPIGLAINPTEKAAKLCNKAITGVEFGKKTSPKIIPAAKPYKAKSVYSIVVPSQQDTMAR